MQEDPLMYIVTCALMVEDGPCSREDKMARYSVLGARTSTLRVELEDWNGVRVYAKYGKFNIGDE